MYMFFIFYTASIAYICMRRNICVVCIYIIYIDMHPTISTHFIPCWYSVALAENSHLELIVFFYCVSVNIILHID